MTLTAPERKAVEKAAYKVVQSSPEDEGIEDFYWRGVLAGAEALAAMRGWQPTETAPRDGTRVILAFGEIVVVGHWLDNSKTSHPWQGWLTSSGPFHPDQLAAWCPLPAPPLPQPPEDV